MNSSETRKTEEDAIIRLLNRRDSFPARDRLTPRMAAREIINTLDEVRAGR